MSLRRKPANFHVRCWVQVPLRAPWKTYQNSCETDVVSLTQRFISLTNRATPEPELPRLPCITPVSRFIVWAFACWTDSMEGETAPLLWSYHGTSSQEGVKVQRSQAVSPWLTRLPSAVFWHAQETRLAAVNTGGLIFACGKQQNERLTISLKSALPICDLWCLSLTPTMTPQLSALAIRVVTTTCVISM